MSRARGTNKAAVLARAQDEDKAFSLRRAEQDLEILQLLVIQAIQYETTARLERAPEIARSIKRRIQRVRGEIGGKPFGGFDPHRLLLAL